MKDYFGYQDKICVVTGAASGMGKATTEMLVDLGAQVWGMDMNEVSVPGIAGSVKVNLSDKDSIDAAFKQLPERIDKFFGCAGLSGVKTDYWTTVTVNFIANKYMTETYLDKRVPNGGAIAFITSTGGLHWEKFQWEFKNLLNAPTWESMTTALHNLAPKDGYGSFAYTISKRCTSCYVAKNFKHFAEKDIRFNCLMPASTDTGMKAEFSTMMGGDAKLLKQSGIAGRLATSREMGEPLVFLNSDMASYITGYQLIVDYGDTTLKILKEKKDLQNMPMALKIYNTAIAKKVINWYITKMA